MSRLGKIILGLWSSLLLAAGLAQAETAIWSDDFETNPGSHWGTDSVWRIGSPTVGPAKNSAGFRTHSGTHCAATGLTKNAPALADSRLVCTNYNGSTNLFIPAASQHPRLRFWQWFNFVNAQGVVEIRTGTNAWQAISPTISSLGSSANTSSGVWSRPSVDLSAFAGSNVQIAFHFLSGASGYGNDPGWYVDDVAVVTNAPVFNSPDGFEAGLGDWSMDAGTWEVGTPTSNPNQAHNGTNCAGTVLAGNYGWHVDSRLISPPLLVASSNHPALRYSQWFNLVNAECFVEIRNGLTNIIGTTNITITTNAIFSSLNTNLYQLSGAAVAGYTTPFYWNPTVGGWTNATKVMGNVYDVNYGAYFFEAGYLPLVTVGEVCDYRAINTIPTPRSSMPTNYFAWQGMVWNSANNANDNPVGHFGTNYSYTYTTNSTVTFTSNNWQTISQTLIQSIGSATIASPGWTNAIIDLSAFSGQSVQVAFHFQSGGSGYGNASGWYVDDLGFAVAPVLILPTNQIINAGQTLTVTNFATNSLDASSTFTFGLVPPFTNATITTGGELTLTNTAGLVGTNVIYIKVADNYSPPLAATNSFKVFVLPPKPPTLSVSNLATATGSFQLSFQTPWTNTTWRLVATTNLNATNWLPVFTNLIGSGGSLQFTDGLSTNFPQRFYRAVFP